MPHLKTLFLVLVPCPTIRIRGPGDVLQLTKVPSMNVYAYLDAHALYPLAL